MVEFLPLLLGAGGLFYAYHIYNKVKEYPEGNDRVREIGDQIHLGAMVFMRTEYRMLLWYAGVDGEIFRQRIVACDRLFPTGKVRLKPVVFMLFDSILRQFLQ